MKMKRNRYSLNPGEIRIKVSKNKNCKQRPIRSLIFKKYVIASIATNPEKLMILAEGKCPVETTNAPEANEPMGGMICILLRGVRVVQT